MRQSKLLYLMGASGCGKDSLLRAVRAQAWPDLLIAHRYITRPVELVGENHIALHDHEFIQRRQAGLFALHWQAHGHHYAVGTELRHWLSCGLHVVMNGSRDHLPQALAAFGEQLVPLLIEVNPDCLARRLQARGRENPAEIRQRLLRDTLPVSASLHRLHNDGPLEETVCQFREMLDRLPALKRHHLAGAPTC